jgi:hypothetical protein
MISNMCSNPRKRGNSSNERRNSGRVPSLCDTIKANMVLQDEAKLRFIPATSLKSVIGKEEIAKALKGSQPSPDTDITTLVPFVCEEATRIFAMLAWNNAENLIEQFYEHDFRDDLLPIGCNTRDMNNFQAFSYKTGGRSPIENHPFNYTQWTERNLEHLCDDQWLFLSPVFTRNQFRYDFHESIRLPFVDRGFKSQKESFFSVVQEWRIHRDHLQTSDHMVSLFPLSPPISVQTEYKLS